MPKFILEGDFLETEVKQSNRLGEESIKNLLIEFSIPAIIGMLVNALYNIVDRIFIGRGVGELAIGGIFVGMPISIIILAFSMLVGVGGNTLVSIRLGQDRKDDAEKIIANSLTLLVIISLILTVIGIIFLEPILLAFGATEGNLVYAMDYMRIILFGLIFQMVGFGLNNFIRGEGNPKVAMMTMLIGAAINIILDPILIIKMNMGVKGAAYATIISQAVTSIWVLWYFIGGNSFLSLKLENMRLKMDRVKEIFVIGFSPFSMQLASSLVTVLLNKSLSVYGGELAISSMSVIQSINMMILMPVFGINQGVQPIMGYNYGAKKYDRLKESFKYAAIAATGITTLGFLLGQLFPVQVFKLFLSDPVGLAKITEIGVPGLRIHLAAIPIVGFQVIGSNFFQATEQPKHAMFLSLSRQVLILIPTILILPNLFGLGVLGVWLAVPISDMVATILTAILLKMNFKDLDVKIENQEFKKLNNY